MILYKDNKLDGKHEMTVQEIADSFIKNGDLDYDHVAYYGLHTTIIYYVGKFLGSWPAETEAEQNLAQQDFIEIYDLVKPVLMEKKLSIWGPKPAQK